MATAPHPIMGRARDFIPGDKLFEAMILVATTVQRSFLEEIQSGKRVALSGSFDEAMLLERMKVAYSIYTEFRDPKGLGWEHRKVLDHIPLLLRCKIDGANWQTYIQDDDAATWSRTGLKDFGARAHGTEKLPEDSPVPVPAAS